MIILSLDLSLASTGYAVANVVDGEIDLIEYGSVNNKKYAKRSQSFRLNRIALKLRELCKTYPIDVVVKERGFTKGHISTQALFKVAGVADLMCFSYGHEHIEEYTVASIKKAVTGNGKADKTEVANSLHLYVGEQVYDTDDESDAVAVLVTYCIDKGLIKDY